MQDLFETGLILIIFCLFFPLLSASINTSTSKTAINASVPPQSQTCTCFPCIGSSSDISCPLWCCTSGQDECRCVGAVRYLHLFSKCPWSGHEHNDRSGWTAKPRSICCCFSYLVMAVGPQPLVPTSNALRWEKLKRFVKSFICSVSSDVLRSDADGLGGLMSLL